MLPGRKNDRSKPSYMKSIRPDDSRKSYDILIVPSIVALSKELFEARGHIFLIIKIKM